MVKKSDQKLTAAVYLKKINNRVRLSKDIILTPLPWLAKGLVLKKKGEEWSANKAMIYRGLKFGNNEFDLLVCLPGASMALITMEEAMAAGARHVFFIGTGGSVAGKNRLGDVVINPYSVSVLNPYTEHEKWNEIKSFDVVDMESRYLSDLAKKKNIEFNSAIIISDAIWRNRWAHSSGKINEPIKIIKEWLMKI
jgi:Phosphorylase superfamily.